MSKSRISDHLMSAAWHQVGHSCADARWHLDNAIDLLRERCGPTQRGYPVVARALVSLRQESALWVFDN